MVENLIIGIMVGIMVGGAIFFLWTIVRKLKRSKFIAPTPVIPKKKRGNFFFFCLILGVISLILVFGVFPEIPAIGLNPIIVAIIALSLLFIAIIGAIIVLLTSITSSLLEKKGDAIPDKITLFGKNGIIKNIPANHARVIRNNLNFKFLGLVRSTPGKIEWDEKNKKLIEKENPKNYIQKPEGWSWYIPILQTEIGIVDLSIEPFDPELVTVNVQDNQTIDVDWWSKMYISDPTRYLINIGTKEEKENFQSKIVNAILEEICSGEKQDELTSFKKDKIKEKEVILVESFNENAKPLGMQAASIDIKKFLPPKHVKDAAELITVSGKRKMAAINTAEELKTIIAGTKAIIQERGEDGKVLKEKDVIANPTWIAVAERLGEIFSDVLSNGFGKKKGE